MGIRQRNTEDSADARPDIGERLRVLVEGIFASVGPQSRCAYEQYFQLDRASGRLMPPETHEHKEWLRFYSDPNGFDEMVEGLLAEIRQDFPDSAEQQLIWRITPEVEWRGGRDAKPEYDILSSPAQWAIYLRFSAVPKDALMGAENV